jgi:hypothetical protein
MFLLDATVLERQLPGPAAIFWQQEQNKYGIAILLRLFSLLLKPGCGYKKSSCALWLIKIFTFLSRSFKKFQILGNVAN